MFVPIRTVAEVYEYQARERVVLSTEPLVYSGDPNQLVAHARRLRPGLNIEGYITTPDDRPDRFWFSVNFVGKTHVGVALPYSCLPAVIALLVAHVERPCGMMFGNLPVSDGGGGQRRRRVTKQDLRLTPAVSQYAS